MFPKLVMQLWICPLNSKITAKNYMEIFKLFLPTSILKKWCIGSYNETLVELLSSKY